MDSPIFTQAAEDAINKETLVFHSMLRETATREALMLRGRPVEVTASDVNKAVIKLTRQEIRPYERILPLYRRFRIGFYVGSLALTMGFLGTILDVIMGTGGTIFGSSSWAFYMILITGGLFSISLGYRFRRKAQKLHMMERSEGPTFKDEQ